MKTYMLLKHVRIGDVWVWDHVCSNPSISIISDRIKELVKSGCRVCDLKIVQDVPFEFKCAIKLKDEGEEPA